MLKRIAWILVFAFAIAQASLPNIKAPISDIDINGIDENKVMPVIGLKKGDTYTAARARAARSKIAKALKASGYMDSQVTVSAKQEKDGVALTFDINKGKTIKIKKVTFIGNKHIDKSELERPLVNKEGGFFSWIPFVGGGDAVPSQLPYDQMRVRDVYLQHGYIDAQVSTPLMKTDFSTNTAEITYNIKEGQPYTVSSVKVTPVAGLNMEDVNEELKLHSGKVFNVEKLRKDIQMLQQKVGDLGYAFAKIEPIFKKNSAKKTIAVTYRIIPGRKIYIHDVIISGNTKTKDHVVRRYIYLAPGDLFNFTDLKDSKDELQRTGFFDKVKITPRKVGSNKIDLLVNVKDAQTGSISAGVGYGSYEGFGISGSLSDRNIFGTGIAGSLSLDLSKKSHNYSLAFTDPRVFDSLYSLSVGVYHSKYEFIDYTKKEKGGYISVGRKITRHISASVGYSYSDVDYSDYTGPATDYEAYTKSSILASITYDNTDDFYNPRSGYYAKLNLEYAGLGSSGGKKHAKFLRTDFKFAAFYGLQDMIDYDLILRYKLRVGYITNKGYTPRAERLYLGGATWGVRGFSPASISPVDATGTRIGGMKSVVNSIEASIPLSLAKNMRLTAFVDYGMIGTNTFGEVKRGSVGAQIEWRSPFGPINLVFAKPINKKSGDRTQIFEFTMGKKF